MDAGRIDARQVQKIASASFSAKYKSKAEIFRFLTVDVKCYLPKYENITIYFLKDVIKGSKKCKSIIIHI